MYSEHVHKVGVSVETSVTMNHCAIFLCNTNISQHRGTHTYLTVHISEITSLTHIAGC